MTAADYDAWAWLYDRTLGPDYRDRRMAFLERALLRGLSPGARVLDLCCGAGQMSAAMLARGFAVEGLDLSAGMLACAARNAPAARLTQGDARDFRLDRPVDGVVCASASLNHMATADDLRPVFRSVHAALAPGGVFVFDVNHPDQMARHWRGVPAAGEIRADWAWMITPSYDPTTRSGAFRVDMHRRPEGAAAGSALWRAVLARPLMKRARLRRLAAFRDARPDWEHRRADYPVHARPLPEMLALLAGAGFEARAESPAGGPVTADGPACFVCRKSAAARMEAAE